MQHNTMKHSVMQAIGISIGSSGFIRCSIPDSTTSDTSFTPSFTKFPTARGTTPRPFSKLSVMSLGVMSSLVKLMDMLGGFHRTLERFMGIGIKELAFFTNFIILWVSLVVRVRFFRMFWITVWS